MFTFRFESHTTQDETVQVIQADEYRLLKKGDGAVDVMIPNKAGVDICHPVGKYDGAYDRCFVMNDSGATIDKIVVL